MTRTPAERDIQAEIMAYLGAQPWCRLFRSGVGLARTLDGRRTIRVGFCKGASDLVGILAPEGRFLAIEVKRPGGTPTNDQINFLYMIQCMGGVSIVARSLDQAIAELKHAGYPR